MSKYNWRSSVVIVTGASSGIGRATSMQLAQKGACLALAARRKGDLETLAQEIRAMGSEALVVPIDVTSQNQVHYLVHSVLRCWGQVDVLIVNAGQYVRAPIIEMSLESLERSMAVNFYAGVFAIQAVLPNMLERRKGEIVLVSSMDAKMPIPPDAPYAAAKCALSGLGDILRQELYGSGVNVTVVYPGRIDTPMIETIRVPSISKKIPPEDVAHAIIKGIERGKAEVFVPAQVKSLYYVKTLFPRLADWLIRKLGISGEDLSLS